MKHLKEGTPCFEAFLKHYHVTDKEWYCVGDDSVEFTREHLDELAESFLLGWNSSAGFYSSFGGE